MLGYMLKNNDVHIFLEDDDAKNLETQTITGTFINLDKVSETGTLEASIDKNIGMLKTSADFDEETWLVKSMSLKLNERNYEKLMDRGSVGTHEVSKHIDVIDTNNLDRLDYTSKSNYKFLLREIGREVPEKFYI